ncbi:MAG: amidase domain-containing protein [Eubacterium sp.]|nr:amidase domain-containing protein [Eubacterium sp.]
MERKILNQKNSLIFAAALALCLCLCGIAAGRIWRSGDDGAADETIAETTGDYIVTTRNTGADFGVDPQEEALILDYMAAWFDSLASLEAGDMTQFFLMADGQGAVRAQIDQTALDFLTEIRGLQENDLSLRNYLCGVTYQGREVLENGDVRIALAEDHQLNFSFIPEVNSYSSGIAHVFVLRGDENGNFRFISHEKEEDGYLLVQDNYEADLAAGGTDTSGMLNQIKAALLSEAKENIAALNDGKDIRIDYEASAAHGYNRDSAVAYAMAWVDETEVIRNGDWDSYDVYGGNCNNFISQCLYAGGIPMDYTGDAQWKWYDDEIDFWEEPYGRSTSWTGVEEFFTYAQENTGYGLAADTTLPGYAGEAGDVIQYGEDGQWHHSVIVTEVIKDENGRVQDYLINSNTTDRINYPASAYAYSNFRLIHVLGWNE